MDPNGAYLTSAWQEHVYPLAERMGFTMKRPQVQPRTRLAHSAAKWATAKRRFDAFNIALFKSFFQDGRDIGKVKILMQIAEELGMDPAELESALQSESYLHQVLVDEEMAREAEVRAVPAYVLQGKVLAAGVQSPVQLQHLISLHCNSSDYSC